MPGSPTTPGWPSARVGALGHIAFHYTDSVGTRYHFSIAAQWLACTFPCRRFADILADACARLGANVGRYSFIAVDLHHLLLAGLPAHLCENAFTVTARGNLMLRRPRVWDIRITAALAVTGYCGMNVSDEPRPRSERLDGQVLFAAADQCLVDQRQGVSSAIRLLGQLLTSLVSTSVRYASGLTPCSLQVSIS